MASTSETSLYNIKKMDGSNFPFWKKQIWHVLVQKKKSKPIQQKGVNKLEDMTKELDELACSTIMLTLVETMYFNVAQETTSYSVGKKLCDLYEKQSAPAQVYWLKKLVDLKMNDNTPMSNHLNEFNTIFSQLSAQGIKLEDSVKAMFLLVTLPESWEAFPTSLSNFAHVDGLTSANVEGSLLTEEVNKKNSEPTKGSTALVARGRSNAKGKSGERSKSRSKSHGLEKRDIECYHFHKKRHMKKDCPKWKAEKGKDKEEGQSSKGSNVKIKESNVACIEDDGEILFTLDLDPSFLLASDGNDVSDWIIDLSM